VPRFDTITDADFSVEVVADLDEEDVSVVTEAVAKRVAAEAASTASSSATVDAILRLDRLGLPSRDIGILLGVSFQHAAKVAAAAKKSVTLSKTEKDAAKSKAATMSASRSGPLVAVKKKVADKGTDANKTKPQPGRRKIDA
jgi:hypothetical protein